MAIQSQTIDCPLIAMNQSWPTTAGVAGRLLALNNAIAEKWMASEAGSKLRAVKRDGFVVFDGTIRDTDGTASAKSLADTSMLIARGRQLIASADANLLAYSTENPTWFTPEFAQPTQALSESVVVNRGAVDILPDSCHIAGLTLSTWTNKAVTGTVSYVKLADIDGTVLLKNTVIGNPFVDFTVCSKCVADPDGTRFWLIVKPENPATPFAIYAYDLNGELLDSELAALPQGGSYFDVIASTESGANGFVIIQGDGGVNFETRKVTWSGSIVVGAAVASAGGNFGGRLAFLRNDSNDHKYHVVTVDGAGPYDFWTWLVDDVTLASSAVLLAAGQTLTPFEITGVFNQNLNTTTVCLSFLDISPTPQLNYTQIWTLTAGVATLRSGKPSLTIVSRVLLLDNKYYVVGYYQSDPSSLKLTNNIQQSTFYLIDLNNINTVASQLTYQTCGAWAIGTGYADWQRVSTPEDFLHLSSVDEWQDGSSHVQLSFRARSFTTAVTLEQFQGENISITGNRAVNTVGVKDFGFGEKLRRGVEFASEALISGARTISWEGVPTNHGITLVTEMVIAPLPSAAATGLTPNGTYEVVAVMEWTDANGQRVRSIAGPPYAFTMGAGERHVTYTGTVVENEVGKDNLTIALYRTAFIDGIQSVAHYKVTDDLNPLLNNPGSLIWTFLDTMTDADAAANEILYTDKGFLDRQPCPPFTDGTADAQRAYVVGYDGAVWFSGSKTEGDATWFNSFFRIILNDDIPQSLALLDNTLVIFGKSTNIYVVSTASLPANDGSGGVPTPTVLPLTHGCTGPVAVCSAGVLFPSTQGGIWLVNRALQDIFIGKDVKEFVEQNGPCLDMYVDAKQRVHCLMSTGVWATYDAVTSCWSTNSLPSAIDCMTVANGELCVATGLSTVIAHQSPGVPTDDNAEIISTVKIQFQLGGVRNFKRIWDMQFEGEWRGEHELTVNGYFDDNNVTVVETYVFTPDNATPYIYDLPPAVEECANLTLEFIDSFPIAPSAGFALEMVSFELGVLSGLDRLSPTERRKPAT